MYFCFRIWFYNILIYSELLFALFPLKPKARFSPRNNLFDTEKYFVSR